MMSSLDKRANRAIDTNGNTNSGGTADIAITTHGSDLYFAICAAMGLATLIFMGLALRKPRQQRIFHYITAGITMVATIAYFSMGSNLGWTPIEVEYHRSNPVVAGNYREIFYVRYIDWVITTPLLLMDLLLTAGMPWPSVLWVILVDEVMIITGLVGALVRSDYKWGYFAVGCAALVYIIYVLAWEARLHANHLGSDIGHTFLMCGSLTAVLWTLYPVAWGICEGGNVIAPDSEAIFYSILDFFAKPVFGSVLLFGHRNIDPARLGLRIRDYDEDPSIHGGMTSKGGERHHGNGASNAHSNGASNNGIANGATNAATSGATNGGMNGHQDLHASVINGGTYYPDGHANAATTTGANTGSAV